MSTRNPFASWLPSALRYVDIWLGFQISRSEQPGCAIAIAAGGEMVFERAYGTADLSTGAVLTSRHRVRVASHSKTFTAVAIMMLREQGRLRLDDTVGSYVGDLPDQLAGATLGQLLSHTAGLTRDGGDCSHWDDLRPFPDEAALRRELSEPLVIGPGERLKYSNVGYGLLGLVIAAITAESFESWVAREVIARIGLKETVPDLPSADAEPFASGHTGRLPVGREVIPGRNPARALAAAAGFVSTPADLARFFSQLDPAAPSSILSAASRREMTRRHWKSEHSKAEIFYGLGTTSGTVAAHDCFGHSGAFYGYASCTTVVPDLGTTASIIINAVDGPASDWLEGVFHIIDRFAKAGATRDDVAAWEGRWWNAWGAVDLVPMGAKVLVASPDATSPFADATEVEVTSAASGTITAASAFGSFGEPVERSFGVDGRPDRLSLAGEEHLPEADFIRLRRQAITARDDIVTPRLILRLMNDSTASACLRGDVTSAGSLLGATVPDELLGHLSGLRSDRMRHDEDPGYRPWSTRAIILPDERKMVGHVRFHSRPDPVDLRGYGPGVVEIGYRVFAPFRQQGYATEAVVAIMEWAATTFGVRRFVASVSPDNKPSLRLVARLGFVKIAEAIDDVDGIEHVFLGSRV